MRRLLLILTVLFVCLRWGIGQTVDSIKVQQSGDFIRIGYKILDSKPGQIYRVRVLCSINGGLNTEIRSVSGDTGDNVQGGKPEYFVVWDVLRDVNELKSAEFIVRAELKQDISQRSSGKGSRLTSIMPVIQLPGPGFGVRLSIMGKAGFSVQYVNGKTSYTGEYKDRSSTRLHRISFGPTFRLVNTETDQMHLFLGGAVGQNWIVEKPTSPLSSVLDYNLHFSPGLEAGIILCQKRTLLNISVQKFLPSVTEEGEPITKTLLINAGFGIRF